MNDFQSMETDDGIDLRLQIARIRARIWWVVASVVLFTGVFITAALVLTPIYRATVVLIPAKSDHDSVSGGSGVGGLGGVASLVGIKLGGSDSLQEEALAVLESRQFTERFINDLDLVPILYSKLWDPATKKWKVDEKHQPTPAGAYHRFDKIRNIVQGKKTSLVKVSIDWTDRYQAAVWANELVRRLNLEMRQREMTRDEAAVGYLENEFEKTTTVATREAISHLIEMQIKQRMLAVITPEFAFRIIDPAVAPERGERQFPNRFMMAVAGPIVGTILGVFGVLAYAALKSSPHPARLRHEKQPEIAR